MEASKTTLYSLEDLNRELISQTLKEVYMSLQERGYQPINQLVGYLISGDPGYISSHNGARQKISKLDSNQILEVLLKEYLEK